MHQPYYKDPLTCEISMPWVRLHGIKDYLDMVQILDEFPNIRQNFNLAPSLIEQIKDYEDPEKIKDRYMDLSLKNAAELTVQDKINILSTFFMANWNTMIERFWKIASATAGLGHVFGGHYVCVRRAPQRSDRARTAQEVIFVSGATAFTPFGPRRRCR